MHNDNLSKSDTKPGEKNTVGEVGSQVDRVPGEEQEENPLLSNSDLKGKKIDADLEREQDKPAEQ
ncbi:MAG: hypothetical protein JWQ96_779 [Segetibacter sp.]|nr:hypothetical protein [Segetibacter sp.]